MTAFTQACYPGMVGTSRQALWQYQARRWKTLLAWPKSRRACCCTVAIIQPKTDKAALPFSDLSTKAVNAIQ